MTAIVLAGGKSSRMGFNKAFLKVGGVPIIKRQLQILRSIFKKIIIVTNTPQKFRFKEINLVTDIIPEKGPLGGIYSGLLSSSSYYNFVVACDMPFLSKPLIRYMIRHKHNYDILIPKIDKKFHPLFGIYTKNCLAVIGKTLKKGKLNVSNIFTKVNCFFLSSEDIKRYDEDLLSLFNLNTPNDLARARIMI